MRSFALIAAAAASAVAAPALAVPADASAPPYRASFDAARQRYCLRVFDGAAVADPRPERRGLECMSEARWATRGVRFERVSRTPAKLSAD